MRRALARRIDAKHPIRDPSGLAEQILGIADTLTQILEHAAALDRPIPPPIGNVVHDHAKRRRPIRPDRIPTTPAPGAVIDGTANTRAAQRTQACNGWGGPTRPVRTAPER